MLFNPGGPGAEGLDFPGQLAPLFPPDVLGGYDLIGFDPRGVGHSMPVTCGLTPEEILRNTLPFPAPDGSIAADVAFSRRAARGCALHSGSLLPYITTANTARDIDRIRAALGERKISYYGGSYGSYLGAVYASLFPRRTDRMVLDSAVDPTKVWYEMWRTWSVGAAERFPDATAYVAQHDDTIRFGTTPATVTANYMALARQLDATPVAAAGVTLTGNLLRSFTYSLLYYDLALPELAKMWRAAANFVAGTDTADDATVVQEVLGFVDVTPSPGVPADNADAAAYAVLCDDVSWPRRISTYASNTAEDRTRYPLTAGMPANIWPCAFWPTNPIEPPVSITDRGRHNILILQNERDPATPLVAARGLRRALGGRASLVTVDAGGHGVIVDGNACANALTSTFLTTGGLPSGDVACPAR